MLRQQSIDFRHASIQTDKRAVVIPTIAILSADAHGLSEQLIIRCDYTTLTRHHQLRRAQTEHLRIALRAQKAPAIPRAKRMSCVKDQAQVMPAGNPLEFIDLGRVPKIVDRNYCRSCRSNHRFDRSRIQSPGMRIDIDKNRFQAKPNEGADRRNESKAGYDHFTAEVERPVNQHQPRGTVRNRDRVSYVKLVGNRLLQTSDLHTFSQDPAFENGS